jgi:hypothetical protein
MELHERGGERRLVIERGEIAGRYDRIVIWRIAPEMTIIARSTMRHVACGQQRLAMNFEFS